jgi:DNA invertase Pin-like site-specific DNA recombinase
MRLDENLRIDKGVSATHGLNASKGALGQFIKLIESGQIQRGSALLVESPDRVSRQRFSEAWPTHQRILDGGVEIHFVSLSEVLKPDHSFVDILRVGIEVDRANNESKIKSKRISAAWARKRRQANGQCAMSARLPAWLIGRRGEPIKLIRERARLINRIYRMALSGLGQYEISRQLNDEAAPTWNKRTRHWSPDCVGNLLRSRAVLGEYTPHHSPEHGPRVPDGDPIANYYPAIVPLDLWQRVQERRRSIAKGKFVTGNPGGGTNSTANLFRNLVFDVNNDCPMVFRHCSKGEKSYDFLVSKYRGGKPQHKIPYAVLEQGFFTWADQLDWARLALDKTASEDQPLLDALGEVAKQIAKTSYSDCRTSINDPSEKG